MAEEIKKDENLEGENKKSEGENKEPDTNQNGNEGAQNPPAEQNGNDNGKKENVFVKAGKAIKKGFDEKVKPAAKKAAPWVGGAVIGAAILGGALIKKGLDDSAKSVDDDDSDDEDDAIDVDGTFVDAPETEGNDSDI